MTKLYFPNPKLVFPPTCNHSRPVLDIAVELLYYRCVGTVQQAMLVLRNAEQSLRGLIERAAAEQRYRDVAEIAKLADGITRLLSGQVALRAPQPRPQSRHVGSRRVAAQKKTFPRFLRDREKLVKVGWSKKSASEYQHRVPWEVVQAVLDVVKTKVGDGELFAATDVVPQLAESGVPDYQVYVVLKWLHTEGVVSKHGRDRYAIEPSKGDLRDLWRALPVVNARVNGQGEGE